MTIEKVVQNGTLVTQKQCTINVPRTTGFRWDCPRRTRTCVLILSRILTVQMKEMGANRVVCALGSTRTGLLMSVYPGPGLYLPPYVSVT